MKIYRVLPYLLASVIFCFRSAHALDEKVIVVASIEPLAGFVDQIGGDLVNVKTMVPPGANPHVYEPSPGQLQVLNHASLYVAAGSGIEFEVAWLEKIKSLNRNLLFCDSSEGIVLIESSEFSDKDAHHNHSGYDPHIWLSPKNAIVMTQNIKNALIRADPRNESAYSKNADRFIAELAELREEVRTELSKIQNHSFLVYHPAWNYFANEFGLQEVSIESDGKEPSVKRLAGIIREGKGRGSKSILVSPQFSQKSARMVASELGAEVVIVNDLARNYIENIRTVTQALKKDLSL